MPLTALLPALFAFPSVQDQALPPVETVLERFEKALGSEAARAKNLVLTGKLTLGVPPSADAPRNPVGGYSGAAEVREAYAGDGRARCSIDWGGGQAMTMGATAEYCWTTDPALAITIKQGDDAAPVRRMFGTARGAPWRTMYERAELVGKRADGDRPCFELRMLPRQGPADTWFVDCETYALGRVDTTLPDPMGGTLAMQFRFEDYRPVDGVRHPFRKQQIVGDLALVTTYSKVEHPDALAAEAIAPGPEVLAAWQDPERRTPQAPEKPGECTLETIAAQPVATIRLTIAPDEVSSTLARVLPEVGSYLARAGVQPVGPPFARYHTVSDLEIDLEAGIAVAHAVPGAGRVHGGELPGGRAAMVWHVGSYHELPETHRKLEQWIQQQALHPSGGPWEIYWTDPGIEPDPTKWRTQILWPVE